jgi:endonuclease/exonuclease/phosphatase family metal-dependent hydrolase
MTLRMMTFNVCGLPSMRPPLAARTVEFCRHIEATDVDVLNLQEIFTRRSLERIRAGLPSFRHVAWRPNLAGQPAGGLATFSRRPLGQARFRSFAGVVPDQGSLRFRAKRAINSLLQGWLTTDLTGLGVTVVNTHLTANKDGDWSAGNRYFTYQRRQLSRLHAGLADDRTGAMILTGDFNLASAGPLYPLIVDSGRFRDPYAEANPTTYHAHFLPGEFPAHRIDYLLVRGGATVREVATMFDSPVDGHGYVSDHVALTARLDLNPPQ